jgi:hypothetical protein
MAPLLDNEITTKEKIKRFNICENYLFRLKTRKKKMQRVILGQNDLKPPLTSKRRRKLKEKN